MSKVQFSEISTEGPESEALGGELRRGELAILRLVRERPGVTVGEIADELMQLGGTLAQTRRALQALVDARVVEQRDAQMEQVIQALLPAEVPPPAAVWHAQQSAQARVSLLREWGAWSAGEVAERAGSTAATRSALASAWRATGRVLGVDWHGRTLYPAFQFDAGGQPRRVLGPVLSDLRRAGLSDWQIALWFTSATGWLDDRRPVDLLDEDPEAVLAAAVAFDQRPT